MSGFWARWQWSGCGDGCYDDVGCAGRRGRRSQSMGMAHFNLPIILEESLDDEESEDCVPSESKKQYVLRSVSEQHPSSKHGRDVLMMVSKKVSTKAEDVCLVDEADQETKSNNNCFSSSQMDNRKRTGHVSKSPQESCWHSSTRVVYYRG